MRTSANSRVKFQAGRFRERISAVDRQRVRATISAAMACVFGVNAADLSKPTRGRAHSAFARQVAMYLAHVGGGLNLTEVGRVFGRDRTTVAHACRVVEDRRDDPVLDHSLQLMEWVVQTGLREDPCIHKARS